ncbi:hypothetical protein U9M48_042616, partial [Paspalum notatum var. saurae]
LFFLPKPPCSPFLCAWPERHPRPPTLCGWTRASAFSALLARSSAPLSPRQHARNPGEQTRIEPHTESNSRHQETSIRVESLPSAFCHFLDAKTRSLRPFIEHRAAVRLASSPTHLRRVSASLEYLDVDPPVEFEEQPPEASEQQQGIFEEVVGEGVDKALIKGEIEGLKCTESGLSFWL